MKRFALGIVISGLLLSSCSSEPPPAPPPRVQQAPLRVAAAPPPGQLSAGAPTAPANLGPVTYDPRERRDPFHPLVEAPREETALDIGGYKLSGIVWQRNQYFALLETPDGLGHILKVNDQLGPNARVKEITKEGVLIEMKGEGPSSRGQVRTIRLELKEQTKKEGQ
jgi:hypothetical protein